MIHSISRYRWFAVLSTRLCVFILVFALTACTAISGTDTPPPSPTPMIPNLDQQFTTLATQHKFAGSVLIARDGKVLLDKGYSLANVEQNVTNKPETRFRIGSITETFTGMGILKLEEQGKLHVKDTICQYLTSCPQIWRSITIDQLLSNMSGIPDYTEHDQLNNKSLAQATPSDILNWAQAQPLKIEPGSRVNFSATNSILLGVIIEKASGQAYGTYIKQAVLDPLNLKDTGYGPENDSSGPYARGYQAWNIPADNFSESSTFAYSAMYSTIDDLYLWSKAVFSKNSTLALPKTYNELFSTNAFFCNQNVGKCTKDNYVGRVYYGDWILIKDFARKGRTAIVQGGGTTGFTSLLVYYPDYNTTAILLSNVQSVQLDVFFDNVVSFIFPQAKAS